MIVDEEQRFGVAQKELLRALRLEVDVLALTATPIPRTLHMSLSGLRDISVIETPPEGRRPIRTYVGEYDEELVKQALEREHARGGQAFYLHNRVETIDEAAAKLRQLCPELRFLVAHGQMRERELEQRMMTLPARRRRRARLDDDHRVGPRHPAGEHADRRARGHARARPALPDPRARRPLRRGSPTRTSSTPTQRELTPEARARLATLADHTELGAGFAIAMRDLEIRGAGDLLGAEQSGHVAALGFELYVEMLHEAVAELSGQRRAGRAARCASTRASTRTCRRATSASEALKIDLHRRLALAETEDELRELHAAIEDRYGPLPGAGREPVRDPGGEAEARARSAPTTSSTAAAGRPSGRSCSAPASCASCAAGSTPPSTRRRKREISLRTDEFDGSDRAGRCYLGARARASLSRRFFDDYARRRLLLVLVRCSRPSLASRPAAAAAAARAAAGPVGRGRRRRRPADHAATSSTTMLERDAGAATRRRSARSRRPGTPEYPRCRTRSSATSSSAPSSSRRRRRARDQGQRQAGRRPARRRSRSSTSAAREEVPARSSRSRG